ncbi:hypothetical protein M9458_029192, partial [Cirrhinus mrigala]
CLTSKTQHTCGFSACDHNYDPGGFICWDRLQQLQPSSLWEDSALGHLKFKHPQLHQHSLPL